MELNEFRCFPWCGVDMIEKHRSAASIGDIDHLLQQLPSELEAISVSIAFSLSSQPISNVF